MPSRFYAHARAFLKATRCVAHLLGGMLTIARFFSKATAEQRAQHIAQWAHDFLRILGVHVRTTGSAVTTGPLLVVANHISWLDILVMLAVQPVRFVSKSDVKHWPLIGWLATNVGTLYIERASRRDALRVAPPATAPWCCPFMPIWCRRLFLPMHQCSQWPCVTRMQPPVP
jgi:1-acyl-sn-glycerol-3-phosphate acyltransferase